jgi:hypothetical protein
MKSLLYDMEFVMMGRLWNACLTSAVFSIMVVNSLSSLHVPS